MLSKIDYNMVIKIQKRYRILEKQVREIEKNVQNINSEFREIDEYISDNLQNAFLENIYRGKENNIDLSMMSKLSVDRPLITHVNEPYSDDDINDITDKPSYDFSSDRQSTDDFSSDRQSTDDFSSDRQSTDDASSSTDYSYTKTYSAQLQYPIQDLALNVTDYVESNPDLTEITYIYCCFSINTENIVPFVLYSVDADNGTIRFPSMTANATDDVNKYVNDVIKGGIFVGYIEDTSTIYLFYKFDTPDSLPGKRATINELYHLKSVDEIAVDETVVSLFSQNKELIHILDLETNQEVDIPFSGYLCGLDDKNAVINIGENEEDDIPIFTDDIFGIGLEGDFYYLTTHKLDVSRMDDAQRYAIFPLDGINYDKLIEDYSEYNSVYYKSDKQDFWAITSVKQIGKI